MYATRRKRVRNMTGDPAAPYKPRIVPENIYMWGGSFWDAWREQASPLAQQQLDQIVAQFKRSTRMNELRYHRSGSILTVQAGTRSLRIELVYVDGSVVEVIDQTHKVRTRPDGHRTLSP